MPPILTPRLCACHRPLLGILHWFACVLGRTGVLVLLLCALALRYRRTDLVATYGIGSVA